jgi:protein TonB
MFEQTLLAGSPPSTRLWSTCAGITGQAILVGATLLVPLIWPAALPQIQSYINIVAPGPPPPPPPPPSQGATVRPRGEVRPFHPAAITIPVLIPDRVLHIVEDPPEIGPTNSRIGVPGGTGAGGEDAIVGSIMASARAAVPPPQARVVERQPQSAPVVETAPIRVPAGGQVQLGAPIHRVDPVYPRTAISMRVEGVVEIEAVVGVDGRIREMKARSGHPFLIPAALEAVRQWVYTPTLLNGRPVEVISPIIVTFRLGNR